LEQRVAVWGLAHDCLGADIAARAHAVLNDEWLTEALRQPLTDQACVQVDHPARRKRRDQAHRPRRIGLRACDARSSRERGSARCQMQKTSAGKFHGVPSTIYVQRGRVVRIDYARLTEARKGQCRLLADIVAKRFLRIRASNIEIRRQCAILIQKWRALDQRLAQTEVGRLLQERHEIAEQILDLGDDTA
jgi:hypothetical protein